MLFGFILYNIIVHVNNALKYNMEERILKKFLEEFKQFALRGNVMDLAVGVIIGAAFQNIVTALTEDFIDRKSVV